MQSLTYGAGYLSGAIDAVTPHWAGAVDIMAVRQQNGTIKSSPFYVRFGKYQSLVRRDRAVKIIVNGVPLTDVKLELGQYGSAFFTVEQGDVVHTTSQAANSEGIDPIL
jgi:phosphatidate phosphatase LPIN